MSGHRSLLSDADFGLWTSSTGLTAEFNADILTAWVAEDPFSTSVYPTGELAVSASREASGRKRRWRPF